LSKDTDITYQEGVATFPSYSYYADKESLMIYLVANKTWVNTVELSSVGMFATQPSQTKRYFLKEFTGVDYVIKFERAAEQLTVKQWLAEMNQIPHVISAYVLDQNKLKHINHLIFD
jgi:hypothetical protein